MSIADADDLTWHADALCAQVDPELFHPEVGQPTREAKKICAQCPVTVECLTSALSMTPTPTGVYGGLSDRERRNLRRPASGVRRPQGDAA